MHFRQGISDLAEILYRKNITTAVVSPGSRNAPLVLSLTQKKEIECIVINDERCAAYYALGIAAQRRVPVALVCTSGTAVLNYAPAIAEAYYRRVPLLILTADRPAELIDCGDGQTIRQENIFNNYIHKSYSFPQSVTSEKELSDAHKLICTAVDESVAGSVPVHINIPLAEPLYDMVPASEKIRLFLEETSSENISEQEAEKYAAEFNLYQKRIIVVGMDNWEDEYQDILLDYSNAGTVIVTEQLSNINNEKFIDCPDKIITGIGKDQYNYIPDLVITTGKMLLSKSFKTFIKKHKPKHWHIDKHFSHDNMQCPYYHISYDACSFLKAMLPFVKSGKSNYSSLWNDKLGRIKEIHNKYLESVAFSDLKSFDIIFNHLPENSILHLGNSTPVRYSSYFHKSGIMFYSNRGVSGIDGCLSTAAGAAYVSDKTVTVITGDMSFIYDSNALWNKHLSKTLRIIVINNNGGNIFRLIDGPSKTPLLEEFFETPHAVKINKIAEAFGIDYFYSDDAESLEKILPDFFNEKENTCILEIKTDALKSAEIFKQYIYSFKDES